METIETALEPIYLLVGQRVCSLRYERGWTQQELANTIGLGRASVANVETGRQRLMLHQIEAMADVFGVSLASLIAQPKTTGVRMKTLQERNAELREDNARLRSVIKAIQRECAHNG